MTPSEKPTTELSLDIYPSPDSVKRPKTAKVFEYFILLLCVVSLARLDGFATQFVLPVALVGSILVIWLNMRHQDRFAQRFNYVISQYVLEAGNTGRLLKRVDLLEKELVEKTGSMARTVLDAADPSSRVLDYDFFLSLLSHEVESARRTSVPICVLLVRPESTFEIGKMGALFRERVRLSDRVALTGAGEIAIMMHNTSLDNARPVCEDWISLHRASKHPVAAGLVEVEPDRDSATGLIERARQALSTIEPGDRSLGVLTALDEMPCHLRVVR